MTLDEFKAWRDGYSQAKRGKLTDKDYAVILQKLDEVSPGHSCRCWRCSPFTSYTITNPVTPTITPFTYEITDGSRPLRSNVVMGSFTLTANAGRAD